MYREKKVLGVTLARGGSKSIPRKNIADVNGFPLIFFTIREALNCSLIDDYVVSSDDEDIIKISKDFGAICPFIRPAILSTDTATSADALIHAVQYMEEMTECRYDYVVELMATNPLKTQDDIENCIKLAIDSNHHSAVAVHELSDHHPARIKFIEQGKLKPFYPETPESRRQDLFPRAFIRSGSIYVTERNFLLENRSRYSENDTLAYVIDNDRVVNIDEPIDLEIVREKLK